MKSFVEAQFGYFPLVWMLHDREINREIIHIHERPPYALSMEITIARSNIYLRRIILSVFP